MLRAGFTKAVRWKDPSEGERRFGDLTDFTTAFFLRRPPNTANGSLAEGQVAALQEPGSGWMCSVSGEFHVDAVDERELAFLRHSL